ncbi:hypothetical protein GQ44DRAFT_773767 [Phaeosphaeriaceae sp. PMI808]|nr:hypothetical protein GQ44DRAFT_773767 [Phaeosphaeriaceae sp. PMI808]
MDQGSSHSQTRKQSAVDRVELIERLKRTKSPVWQQYQHNGRYHRQSPEARSHSHDRPNTPLLSPAQIRKSGTSTPDPLRDIAAAGLEIERPRSALHSGDFRTKEGDGDSTKSSTMPFLATSPVVPWDRSFPPAAYSSHHNNASYSFDGVVSQESHAVSRARAISQSSTSFFAFLPPTSPLVQQANNPDLDLPSIAASRQNSRSPERNNRRHTFSPTSFQPYKSTSMVRSISGTPAARHLRYGSSTPYQAHQPRRSITINQSQSHSNPQTPFLGARRPSFSSEASPLQHAPMVGSYEESILRGRMSTTPSRPLDFVAKIGVLGRGQCKSSLKCPPHVTVPFPAVFYSYNTGNGRISDNEPSPYVGLIDIENSLPAAGESNEPSKRKRRHIVPPDQDDLDFRMSAKDFTGRSLTDDLRKKEKRKRRSTSPKAPPGGSYRIPSQGQLQIVLKNPNNTAVKLFLVPYDISDMESGQKTFIRQRSYSAGPIIDMPMSSRRNLGTDRPEAALSNSEDPNDRPILRYLVHLHMCCPSKGRYYLYKSIRVVFANRVPDGKEKLRNEIQLPEPRFSAYKPMRDSTVSQYMSSTGAQLSNEKAFCRRSAGWPLPRPQQAYDQMDGMSQRPHIPPPAVQFTGGLLSSPASNSFSSPVPTLQPIPFSLTRLAAIESRPVSRDKMDIDIDNNNPFRTPMVSPNSGVGSPANRQGKFEKLNKGDVGYGGNAFTPVGSQTSPPNTGLLSQRLRELEVQREKEKDM